MKIKQLIDFLNRESNESRHETGSTQQRASTSSESEENVVYIENARLGETSEQGTEGAGQEILAGGTAWAEQSMGEILVNSGKLANEDVERIISYQQEKGLYFGEAAVKLKLVSEDDILRALSTQFGYTYGQRDEALSRDLVMAHSPFGRQAEEFRTIRSGLLSNWLSPEQKTLAIVSPGRSEGRSYVAANLALAFSQLGLSTLLIDADMRAPRQQVNFHFSRRVGLSMLLAGRVKMTDLDFLPDQVSNFKFLSVLGSGATPPNPVELLSKNTFSLIHNELTKYFDVIIIDTPSGIYQADVLSIGAVAGNALLLTRSGHSKVEDTKKLMSVLVHARVNVIGAVLNEF